MSKFQVGKIMFSSSSLSFFVFVPLRGAPNFLVLPQGGAPITVPRVSKMQLSVRFS
jgi:hypothetical protein